MIRVAPQSVIDDNLWNAYSILDLLRVSGRATDELRSRGAIRSGNGPIGDYAEFLFATTFGWSLAHASSAGFDATDLNKVRYQIKARRITSRNPSRQLSALRRLNNGNFDKLAAVLFDEDFRVIRAVILPHEAVVGHAKRSDHTNSWRLMLSDRLCGLPEAEDVTAKLAEAQAKS